MMSTYPIWDFITSAWPYIPVCFLGSFLLSFGVIELSQSEPVYRWFAAKLEVSRHKRSAQIRKALAEDTRIFLHGRREKQLSPREQQIYQTMVESYWERIEELYRRPHGKRKR